MAGVCEVWADLLAGWLWKLRIEARAATAMQRAAGHRRTARDASMLKRNGGKGDIKSKDDSYMELGFVSKRCHGIYP